MFNEEQKRRYIKYKENAVVISFNYLEQKFRKAEKFEIKFNKDVSCFNYYEILEMYKTFGLSSYDAIVVMNSTFSLYTEWCVREGLVIDNLNHFKEVTNDDFKACVNRRMVEKQIVDRDTVLGWCNELPNASDAFLILSIFEGIKGKNYSNVALLRTDCVDKDKNTFYLPSGKTVSVSSQLVKYAVAASEELMLTALTGSMEKRIELENDEFVLHNQRQTKLFTEEGIRRRIYYRLERIFSYLGADYMSGNNLTMSGIVHFVREESKKRNLLVLDGVNDKVIRSLVLERFNKKLQNRDLLYELIVDGQ